MSAGRAEPDPVTPSHGRRPLVGELFCPEADRDWEWEALLAGGKLHLYCYTGAAVVVLQPFDVERAPPGV